MTWLENSRSGLDRARKQAEYMAALTCLEPLPNVPETSENTAKCQKGTFVYVRIFFPHYQCRYVQVGARIDLIAVGLRLLRMKWPAWSYHAMYRCQFFTCCNSADTACLLPEWVSI